MSCLFVTIRFHDGRYHGLDTEGKSEWPPSPARLFQALVAGAAQGVVLSDEDRTALTWLELLEPPFIAAPAVHMGQSFSHFMPNNDLDTVGGDPRRIANIRTATKRFHPRIFDHCVPFLYVWSFKAGETHAQRLCQITAKLYQLGRGVDMAWATGGIIDEDEALARLSAYPGAIYRPSVNDLGRVLACPFPGSLDSLIDRYNKSRARFKTAELVVGKRITSGQTFSQPPRPRFRQVSYNCPPRRLLFELRNMSQDAGFFVWPLKDAVRLVEILRNDAAAKLKDVLRDKVEAIERVFGLCRDVTEADKASRIRIIPLPSVGHQFADHGIRRLLLEIPPDCPLPTGDIAWAFAGIGVSGLTTSESEWMLVSTEERGMLNHYGVAGDSESEFRTWRTVTSAALQVERLRGRKKASERAHVEYKAALSVAQALRHAGIASKPVFIRVQREPFDSKGSRAENFAHGARFFAARLWHVEITFAEPVAGPLLIGDGRYLGLGLMKPVKEVQGVYAYTVVHGLTHQVDLQSLTRSLRRAVMKLVQDRLGPRANLPLFFTGHETNGSPASRGGRSHLAFAFDEKRQSLLVIAPHLLDGREPSRDECKHLQLLSETMVGLHELRAGSVGLLKLEPSITVEDDDPLFARATTWRTQTEYRPTRYSKKTTPEQAIVADVRVELRRRGLPTPVRIETISVSRGPRGGLTAQLKLVFSSVVKGPLLLGKTANFGGGLFTSSPTAER